MDGRRLLVFLDTVSSEVFKSKLSFTDEEQGVLITYPNNNQFFYWASSGKYIPKMGKLSNAKFKRCGSFVYVESGANYDKFFMQTDDVMVTAERKQAPGFVKQTYSVSEEERQAVEQGRHLIAAIFVVVGILALLVWVMTYM